MQLYTCPALAITFMSVSTYIQANKGQDETQEPFATIMEKVAEALFHWSGQQLLSLRTFRKSLQRGQEQQLTKVTVTALNPTKEYKHG